MLHEEQVLWGLEGVSQGTSGIYGDKHHNSTTLMASCGYVWGPVTMNHGDHTQTRWKMQPLGWRSHRAMQLEEPQQPPTEHNSLAEKSKTSF